jgi:Ca2+:H+ antiporter
MTLMVRLGIAWATVALFSFLSEGWLTELSSSSRAMPLFPWLFVVMLSSSAGVAEEADQLAELLGEPLGTLILTLSTAMIEVVLIGAVVVGSEAAPTVGRDTMFAVLMIGLNGVLGAALLLGGWRYHEQAYDPPGRFARRSPRSTSPCSVSLPGDAAKRRSAIP